jgi:hypothetical protein
MCLYAGVLKNHRKMFLVLLFLTCNHAGAQGNSRTQNKGIFAEQYQTQLGIIAGFTNVDGGNFDSASNFGIDAGIGPIGQIVPGAEIAYSNNKSSDSSDDLERFTLLAKGSYHIGGSTMFWNRTYAGLAIGVVVADNEMNLVMAPLVGFDIPVAVYPSTMLSAGALVKYLVVSGSEPEAWIPSVAIKYWF